MMHDAPGIAEGIAFLTENDPVFSHLPPYQGDLWPRFEPGFPGLARIVLGQQVSIHSAKALWGRLVTKTQEMTPEAFLSLSTDDCRALGLSRQKISYIGGLAEMVQSGAIDLHAFDEMTDDEVVIAVTTLKGFGVWSAQMYLVFALGRPDVWAPGDLGIQIGLQKYHGLETRPAAVEAMPMGDNFRPYRTAASLLLWYMNTVKVERLEG